MGPYSGLAHVERRGLSACCRTEMRLDSRYIHGKREKSRGAKAGICVYKVHRAKYTCQLNSGIRGD